MYWKSVAREKEDVGVDGDGDGGVLLEEGEEVEEEEGEEGGRMTLRYAMQCNAMQNL